MRGRLIQRFKAEVARLDTDATRTGGHYDDVFRETVFVDGTGDGIGTDQRQEHTPDILPVQIGEETWEALRAHELGNLPQTDLVLWFHYRDLELASLVDGTTGHCLIGVGARLVSIRDYLTEDVVLAVRTPPGLYVTEARPRGWGINMARPTRNLLRCTFAERSAAP